MAGLGSTSTRSGARTIGRPANFYPSPFFDVASNYLPKTIKETFDWCLYYQQTNPIISAITSRLATYPITDLMYRGGNDGVVALYRDLFEDQFNLRTFLVEVNLDRYTYGNSFVSVSFPFTKMIKCPSCKESKPASSHNYKFKNLEFHIKCKSCDYEGKAKARDEPIKAIKSIRLIRWNPKNLVLRHNEITGQTQYFYKIPKHIRNELTLGTPAIVESTPQAFIDAVRRKKPIIIDPAKLFHSKRATPSRAPEDSGWGTPLILPVLKDVFFLQVLKKAQEAVALEHVVPMRVLFPQVTADGSNPYNQINLKDWQKEVMDQVKKWRQDNNHIPIMPVPIGQQLVGGQGKSLLLHQEVRIYNEQIIAGMGVPVGFFYGEAQYSGASVNLRALENEFLGNRQDMMRLVDFLADQVSIFLDVPKPSLEFKPFKMADDLQRASFELGLVQNKLMGEKTFMESRNLNYEEEVELIKEELENRADINKKIASGNADAQGSASLISAKHQIRAQQMQQEAQQQHAQAQQYGQQYAQQQQQQQQGQQQQQQQQQQRPPAAIQQSPVTATGGGMDMFAQARKMAAEIKRMPEAQRYQQLTQLRATNPQLYSIVNQFLAQGGTQSQPAQRPLPEVLPPRRGPAKAQV